MLDLLVFCHVQINYTVDYPKDRKRRLLVHRGIINQQVHINLLIDHYFLIKRIFYDFDKSCLANNICKLYHLIFREFAAD